MKVVGIIAEYNPFHLGHKYHIDKIRETFGEDAVIVAVMSGNFTQRAEPAIFDKRERAEAAVLCGVDLVLEMPFPHCSSGAEFFAEAGVGILNSLGVVDYISFGSECADISALEKAASALEASNLPSEESHDATGYAKRCEEIYRALYDDGDDIFKPNNILGIEYIKALKKQGSSIIPTTVKRMGAEYNDDSISKCQLQSAKAIRALILKNDISAFDYVPKCAKDVYSRAIAQNEAPTYVSKLDAAVISFFRLNSPMLSECDIHDCGGGLYNRIRSASFHTDSISSLIERSKTKKYTTARIRRAIWYSFFGVTSSDVRTVPKYTQILAMNTKGAALLKRIKKVSAFPILTKPSSKAALPQDAVREKELSDKADSVFQLTKPRTVRGDAGLLFSPFVKKGDIPR